MSKILFENELHYRYVQILNVLYIICAERFLNKMLKYANKSWLDLMQWFFSDRLLPGLVLDISAVFSV